MRKIVSFLFVLVMPFLGFQFLFAQSKDWKEVDFTPDPTTMSFIDLQCADSLNCMIKGNYKGQWGHFFRRTTDGGENWENVYFDSSYWETSKHIRCMPEIQASAYPSTDLFIAVGDSGLIMRTSDKGDNWQITQVDRDIAFFNIKMLDSKFGVSLSYQYDTININMLSTTDGGLNWTRMNLPAEYDSAFFIDYQILNKDLIVLLMCKPYQEKELVWVKGDWEEWHSYPGKNNCFYLSFVNENTGWLTGGNVVDDLNLTQVIMHTDDGGKTWEIQRDIQYQGSGLQEIRMWDDKFGITTSGFAFYLVTYNGGKTWNEGTIAKLREHSGDPFMVRNIQMPSMTNAYVIAGSNYIFKYTRDWLASASETKVDGLTLDQNKPNPFSNRTEITYTLPVSSRVSLSVFDIFGVSRKLVLDEYQNAGDHAIIFSTNDLPQGTYFYRLETDKGILTKQMVLFK